MESRLSYNIEKNNNKETSQRLADHITSIDKVFL